MRSLLAVCLLVASSLAHATYCSDGSLIASHPNGDCSVPIAGASSPKSNSSSDAAARAAAAAGAVSGSKSAATGGNASAAGGAGGDASSRLSGIGNDNSSNSFKALAISLPTPVFVPPMPAIGDCPSATVTQSSRAVGWNFVSWADSRIDTDNCTTIKIYGSLMAQCKYRSAGVVLAHLTMKVLPEYRPEESGDVDLTEKECRELSLPIMARQPDVINFVSHIPAACVPVKAPAGRKVVKRKPAAVCR